MSHGLPSVTPDHVGAAINWIFGFFILSVVTAILKGRLAIWERPAEFFNGEAYAILSNPRNTVVLLLVAVIVYSIVVYRATLHLVYRDSGERPLIMVNDRDRHFKWPEYSAVH